MAAYRKTEAGGGIGEEIRGRHLNNALGWEGVGKNNGWRRHRDGKMIDRGRRKMKNRAGALKSRRVENKVREWETQTEENEESQTKMKGGEEVEIKSNKEDE